MAQTKTKTKIKKSNSKIEVKFRNNKWRVPIFILVFSAIGAFAIFIARAQANNCSPVNGGFVCDVNQASSGPDSIVDSGSGEAADKIAQGWTDLGVPFRVPNFAENGAKPVHRFVNAKTNSHALALEGSDYYGQFRYNASFLNGYIDEGIMFWAWPSNTQAGTVPVYAFSDGNGGGFYSPTSYNIYSTNINGGNNVKANAKISKDGIVFYAYPAGYTPPAPAKSVTTTPAQPSQQKVTVAPPPVRAPTATYTAKQDVNFEPVRDIEAENIQQASINNARLLSGLPAIYRSRCLDQSATEKTLDMMKKGVLEHTPPIEAPVDRACGPSWAGVLENIGVGGTSEAIFTAFMNSSEHLKNILNNFQNRPNNSVRNGVGMMGISAYKDSLGKLWITQHFVQCDNGCNSNFTTSSY